MAIFAGTLLPWLNQRDRRLLAHEEYEDEDTELARVREVVRQWRAEAARDGKPLKLPTMPFMLRNIWTAALVLFVLIMLSTFYIRTVFQVRILLLGREPFLIHTLVTGLDCNFLLGNLLGCRVLDPFRHYHVCKYL